jgi:hypothetical protein
MPRTKVFTSILMISILIALSGASVWAAPGGQEPIVEATEEPTAEPTEEPTAEPTEEPPDEEPPTVHPVASALAEFFADTLGLDYDEIMDYHEDGMGFGIIAQACWMSYALEGDATLFGDILTAKKSGDFSSITLPDVEETPTNWGQFKKAILGNDKAQKNLGAIMSSRAAGEQDQDRDRDQNRDQSQDQDQVQSRKGKGSDEEVGGPPAEPPGKSKDKGNEGSRPPAEPPGKGKDKGNKGGACSGCGGEGKGK